MTPSSEHEIGEALVRNFGCNFLRGGLSKDGGKYLAACVQGGVGLFDCRWADERSILVPLLLAPAAAAAATADEQEDGRSPNRSTCSSSFLSLLSGQAIRDISWSPLHVGKGRLLAIVQDMALLVFAIDTSQMPVRYSRTCLIDLQAHDQAGGGGGGASGGGFNSSSSKSKTVASCLWHPSALPTVIITFSNAPPLSVVLPRRQKQEQVNALFANGGKSNISVLVGCPPSTVLLLANQREAPPGGLLCIDASTSTCTASAKRTINRSVQNSLVDQEAAIDEAVVGELKKSVESKSTSSTIISLPWQGGEASAACVHESSQSVAITYDVCVLPLASPLTLPLQQQQQQQQRRRMVDVVAESTSLVAEAVELYDDIDEEQRQKQLQQKRRIFTKGAFPHALSGSSLIEALSVPSPIEEVANVNDRPSVMESLMSIGSKSGSSSLTHTVATEAAIARAIGTSSSSSSSSSSSTSSFSSSSLRLQHQDASLITSSSISSSSGGNGSSWTTTLLMACQFEHYLQADEHSRGKRFAIQSRGNGRPDVSALWISSSKVYLGVLAVCSSTASSLCLTYFSLQQSHENATREVSLQVPLPHDYKCRGVAFIEATTAAARGEEEGQDEKVLLVVLAAKRQASLASSSSSSLCSLRLLTFQCHFPSSLQSSSLPPPPLPSPLPSSTFISALTSEQGVQASLLSTLASLQSLVQAQNDKIDSLCERITVLEATVREKL